jgi:hypothetical protein
VARAASQVFAQAAPGFSAQPAGIIAAALAPIAVFKNVRRLIGFPSAH